MILGTSSAAKRIVIEPLIENGVRFPQEALDLIKQNIEHYSNKQVAIAPAVNFAGPGAGKTYKDDHSDAEKLVNDNVKLESGNGQFVIHIGYLAGNSPNALGVAYVADKAIIYTGQMASNQRALQACSLHESGHLMGLVDGWINRGRASKVKGDNPSQNQTNGGHSTNQGSVMYYAANPDYITSFVTGFPSIAFDAEDDHDLKAIAANAAFGARG